MKKSYELKNNEDVYIDDECNQLLEKCDNANIKRYHIKTITSGEMVEVEIYPVWSTAQRELRKIEHLGTSKAQRNLNEKHAIKRCIRLVNCNFAYGDTFITTTYSDNRLPPTVAEANKEVKLYLRRLARRAEKRGYPKLKYIYTTECGKKSGRIHHHIFTNFPNRNEAEDLWRLGRVNSKRLQPDDFGLEGIARYVYKPRKQSNTGLEDSEKRYYCSLNLKQPEIITKKGYRDSRGNYKRVTKKLVRSLVFEGTDVGNFFNTILPSCRILDMMTFTSEFIDGLYIYVRLRQKEQIQKLIKHEQKRR